MLNHGDVGQFYALEPNQAPHVFFCVGYIRRANPAVVVVVLLELQGMSLVFMQREGRVVPKMFSEVVAGVLQQGGVTALNCRPLEVQLMPHTFCSVALVGKGDAVDVFDGAAQGRPCKQPQRNDDGGRGQDLAALMRIGFARLGGRGAPSVPARSRSSHARVAGALVAHRDPRRVVKVADEDLGGDDSDTLEKDMSDIEQEILASGEELVHLAAPAASAAQDPLPEISEDIALVDFARMYTRAKFSGSGGGGAASSSGGAASSASERQPHGQADVHSAPTSGLEPPPPPPPPHPAPRVAPEPEHRERSKNLAWPVFDDNNQKLGVIVWNEAAKSLDAHCHDARHKDSHLSCNVNRTTNEPRSHTSSSGRPLAFLVAWLHAGKEACMDCRDKHFKARRGGGDASDMLSHERRAHFRALLEADPEWQEPLSKERKPFPTEGPEPLGLP